jgi:hypothetical protein
MSVIDGAVAGRTLPGVETTFTFVATDSFGNPTAETEVLDPKP